VIEMKKPLEFARELISSALNTGEIAIDATCGNGYDTVFLAELVGDNGSVLAFDIQEQAIENTRQRLAAADLSGCVSLILDSHENLSRHLDGPVKAAMFNLGYLPGGNHSVVTKPESTIKALSAVLDSLTVGGMVTLVVYSGHPGGEVEYQTVKKYLLALPQQQFTVLEYRFINQRGNPPLLLAVTRI
jgi:tRNA A58 N-methylase Trm61